MVAYSPYWEVCMIVRRNIKIKHDLRVPLLTSLCGEPFSSSKLQLVLSILYSTKSFDQTHLAIYKYTHIDTRNCWHMLMEIFMLYSV